MQPAGTSAGATTLDRSSRPTDLSIVVITRSRSAQCARMCAILEDQLQRQPTLGAEIILVFDGCASYEWVRDHRLYQTIQLPCRLGIASARNTGLRHAQSPVVAFLDDDALPVDTWLSSLLKGLAVYPHHIAFGGRVIGHDTDNLYARLRDLVYYFGCAYFRTTTKSLAEQELSSSK